MKIVIHLADSEAYRDIECEEENIRAVYRELSNVIGKFLQDKGVEGSFEVIFNED